MHLGFIIALASLKAEMYGLARNLSPSEVHDMAAAIRLPPFQPKQGLKIATTEAEQTQQHSSDAGHSLQDQDNQSLSDMLHSLPPPAALKGIPRPTLSICLMASHVLSLSVL